MKEVTTWMDYVCCRTADNTCRAPTQRFGDWGSSSSESCNYYAAITTVISSQSQSCPVRNALSPSGAGHFNSLVLRRITLPNNANLAARRDAGRDGLPLIIRASHRCVWRAAAPLLKARHSPLQPLHSSFLLPSISPLLLLASPKKVISNTADDPGISYLSSLQLRWLLPSISSPTIRP